MTKQLAGLIKLPCRLTPVLNPDGTDHPVWCDIVDDRGLLIATVQQSGIGAAVVAALNRREAGDNDA